MKDENSVIGMCGLVKRDWLEDVDIGFALCARYEGRGYALEAAQAVLNYAHDSHALQGVLAITTGGNDRSMRLLGKIVMAYEKTIKVSGDDSILELYSIGLVDR